MPKSIVMLMVLSGLSCLSLADNLEPHSYHCQGVPINMDTPETTIQAKCTELKTKNSNQVANGQNSQKTKGFNTNDAIEPSTNQLSKIKFVTDDYSHHICYYKNNKLVKCKLLKAYPVTPDND